MPKAILVSACLLGLPTRYDGRTKLCEELVGLLHKADSGLPGTARWAANPQTRGRFRQR